MSFIQFHSQFFSIVTIGFKRVDGDDPVFMAGENALNLGVSIDIVADKMKTKRDEVGGLRIGRKAKRFKLRE